MKKIILILFLLSSCQNNQIKNESDLSNINFSENLSFEEFKIKLNIYTNNSSYPNIND